jgi:hypothetical protein
MMRMRTVQHIFLLSALAIGAASCGDVVRQGRSPVYLVLDSLGASAGKSGSSSSTFTSFLLSDVITNVTTPDPCSAAKPCPTIFNDTGQAVLRISLKDLATGTTGTATAPTANNEVTITRYHVAYRRADGRNVQGVDVPFGFDGAATGTVPSGGKLTLGFEMVRHVAKEESPLVQLKDNGVIITTIADITFYGRDQVGNDVSVSGSMQIDFGNFGDQ